MKELMVREWRRVQRSFLMEQVFAILVLLCAFIVCKVWPSAFSHFSEAVLAMPQEVYGLFGIVSHKGAGSFIYALLFCVMCLQLLIVCRGCVRAVQILYADEKNGSILQMCGQLYDRRSIVCAKYLVAVSCIVVSMLVTYGAVILIALFGGADDVGGQPAAAVLSTLMLRGIFIVMMLCSVVFSIAVYSKRAVRYDCALYRNGLIFGTLVIGNLYKIRDFLAWFLEEVHLKGALLADKLGWLDNMCYISPISWINPYTFQRISTPVVIAICIIISGAAVFAAETGYRRRRLGCY